MLIYYLTNLIVCGIIYKSIVEVAIMLQNLTPEEVIPLKLSSLYEQYGYSKFRMSKFESYDLYRDNKNFLKSQSIITFTGANGKLMALKPDITLSMIKNTGDDTGARKLYYLENVFRLNQNGNEYSEIRQMGLEYIGGDEGYAETEVIKLALSTLETIDSEYVLGVSHMGYLASFLISAGLSADAMTDIFAAMKKKSANAVRALAEKFGLDQNSSDILCRLTTLSGAPGDVLPRLSELARTSEANAAVKELSELCDALGALAKKVKIDMSVINDFDYYNGIIFNGYIRGIPRAVLSGGRYDSIMRKFGKNKPALGFALYIGELDRALHTPKEYDVDVLLLYGNTKQKVVLAAVEAIIRDGKSVRAEREAPAGITPRSIVKLHDDGNMEVMRNA